MLTFRNICKLFIVGLLLSGLASSQTLHDLKVGDDISEVTLPAQGSIYYKLKMGSEYYSDEDLIIKVVPLNYDSDPDIFISKTVAYPNSSLDADWQCSSYGMDTCTINHKNISRSDVFYIGITCSLIESCKFMVKTLLTSEFQLEDGVEFQTQLFKDDARVFKFTIPQQISDDSSIIIKASSYRGTAHDFVLSIASKQNSDSPGTSLNSRKGQPAWKKGQVLRITKDNYDGWCKGCEIKILLSVQDEGYYHIMAQTSSSQPMLFNGEQVDDIVAYSDIQCYRYYVKNAETNVQVQLTTYSGRVQLQANAQTLPSNWDDFAVKTESNDTELILDMRSRFRQHIMGGLTTGLIYICVKGELSSTYTIRLKELVENYEQMLPIQDGYSEYFFIRPLTMLVHLYHVPKLEYNGEDIKIQFDLTIIRGQADLVIGATMCQENTTKCREDLTQELVIEKNSKYQKAQHTGSTLKLVIDHDEKLCQELFKGDCYYIIAVINPTEGRALYKIIGSHSQNNHILLQENIPHIDSVDMHKYKFYKFSLMEDPTITNVTFEITPLHGDSDLFISKSYEFPQKDNYEKKSQRVGSLVDHIEFQKGDTNATSLAGTYYIGIYGYSYTTFSMLVTLKRNTVTKEDTFKQLATLIHQGFPISKSLHNELDIFYGYFDVSIPEEEDLSIIIEVHNSESKTTTRISHGRHPTAAYHDFKLQDGVLRINPGDAGYHKNGTYYVMVSPDFTFLDLFKDNYYTFTIQWRVQNTIPHLNSQNLLSVVTKPYQYSYLRHFVQSTEDIRISLMSKGHQDVYVSLYPDQTRPTNLTYDFTTKFITGGNYSNGKSLLLPMALIQQNNPACYDLGYADENPCVLYIGIYCQESYECSSQIELDYESNVPKKLYSGLNKHVVMDAEHRNYYYLSVNVKNYDDVYAVLQPLSGDADLYVNIQKLNKSEETIWNLPKESDYLFASKTKLNTEIIHITKKDLENYCGFTNNDTNSSNIEYDDEDCLIVFAIVPADDIKEDDILYNFHAYKGVMEVKNLSPAYGYAKQGEFSFFLYKETCESCNMIISLSSYQNGDPDIYVVKGTRLPSLNDYDLKRMTLHSEVITLNLENEMFKKNNITSMADYYIIGIYGTKNSTFQLSITSQDEQISQIQESVPLKHSQKAYDVVYFQYYHFKKNDIQISLSVSLGAVDVYVTTFNTTSDNFVDQLPQNKNDAIWVAGDINSINQVEGKDILILQNDRDYCFECYYIIGVVTHEGSAKYTLQLVNMQAEKMYSHLLRLGVTKMVKLFGVGNEQVFQFMLESKDPVQIVPTIIHGKAKIYVGFVEDKSQAFVSRSDGSPISINGDQIKTEKAYYIFLEAVSEACEITLTVSQEQTIVTLHDGVPQALKYDGLMDASKYMLFNLPAGNSTVSFNVKSKSNYFFPQLLVTTFDHNAQQTIIFPPSELVMFDTFNDWNKDLYVMKASIQFNNLKEDQGLAINLFYWNDKISNQEWDGVQDTTGSAIITVSHTKIIKLVSGEEYNGELSEGYGQFQLFKIQAPKSKVTVITFSECLGYSTFGVVRNPSKLDERENIDIQNVGGEKQAILKSFEGEAFIIVESFGPILSTEKREFIIQVQNIDALDIGQKLFYVPGNEGHIDFEYVRDRKGNVKLSWGQIYKSYLGQPTEQATDVRYKLVFSENPSAVMDSVCAVKKSSDIFSIQESIDDNYEYMASLSPDKETQFNVIAIVDKEQKAIPYRPITLKVPLRQVYGGKLLVTLLTAALIIFGILALFFFMKGKKLENRLREEVRDIQGEEGGYQTYHKVDDPKNNYAAEEGF